MSRRVKQAPAVVTDSEYGGLVGIRPDTDLPLYDTAWLTREDAIAFAHRIIVACHQGNIDGVEPLTVLMSQHRARGCTMGITGTCTCGHTLPAPGAVSRSIDSILSQRDANIMAREAGYTGTLPEPETAPRIAVRYLHDCVHPGPQDCTSYGQCHSRAYGEDDASVAHMHVELGGEG